MEETNETQSSNLDTYKDVASVITVTATAIVALKKLYDTGVEIKKEVDKRRSKKAAEAEI